MVDMFLREKVPAGVKTSAGFLRISKGFPSLCTNMGATIWENHQLIEAVSWYIILL